MNPTRQTAALPLLLLNGVGTLLLGAGLIGLLAPHLAPPLAAARIAWSLIGVGLILDLASMAGFLRIALKQRQGGREPG
ncbi:MAG: hypothetical protein D6786_07790 [Gammaproteobacteria bacterium]|nr:MAG: hypothetical protein D6786_07790 [Gammaproteobacteria bacterium]